MAERASETVTVALTSDQKRRLVADANRRGRPLWRHVAALLEPVIEALPGDGAPSAENGEAHRD